LTLLRQHAGDPHGCRTESWYSGTAATGDADGALLQGLIDVAAAMDPLLFTLNNVRPERTT